MVLVVQSSRLLGRPPPTHTHTHTMGYDSITKEMHRAGLVALYRQDPSRPILYLDGEEGEATGSFLNKWNVPAHHLNPVNFKSIVVERIEKTFGVSGTVGDVNTILTQGGDDAFAVVWLDYMCRFNEDVHTQAFSEALRVSPHVSVTFSVRGVSKETTTNGIMKAIRKCGKILENITPYKGKSGIENMIKLTLARRQKPENDDDSSPATDDGPAHCTSKRVGGGYEAPLDIGRSVFVEYRGDTLTAIVQGFTSDEVLVRFDYDAVSRWVHRRATSPNRERIQIQSLFGVEMGAPLKIFTKGLKGYETTKKTKKHMFFQIGKQYHRSWRLTVHAILKDGTTHRTAERWTVTPEQALSWKMRRARTTVAPPTPLVRP